MYTDYLLQCLICVIIIFILLYIYIRYCDDYNQTKPIKKISKNIINDLIESINNKQRNFFNNIHCL